MEYILIKPVLNSLLTDLSYFLSDFSLFKKENEGIFYAFTRHWKNPVRHDESQWNIISSARQIFCKAFQTYSSRTRINVTQLNCLKIADHIAWQRPYGIWHHAIVSDVDASKGRLKVFHYYKENGVTKIKEEWIYANKQRGHMFRFDYPEDVTDRNPTDDVLRRARSKLGEKGYNFFGNNCEHFATFCKTGVKASAQANWALGKVKETLDSCRCIFINEGIKGLSEETGKVAVSEAVEAAGHASNWIGAGLVAGFDIAHCTHDIYQMYKQKKSGQIEDRDFKVSATQRVSEGVVGACFTIGGSILIPVVGGTFLGSVLGGAVGSFVGKGVGSIIGNWIGNWLW